MAEARRGGLQFWKEKGATDNVKAAVNAAAAAAGIAAPRRGVNIPMSNSGSWRKYITSSSEGSIRSLVSDSLQFLLYAAVAALILFAVLTLIHFTVYPVFSFTPGDGGFLPIPVFSDATKVAESAPNPPEKALAIGGVPTCGYSIAFDLKIPGDFTNLQTPRVLLYRGSVAIGSGTAPTNGSPPSTTASKEVSMKSYETYLKETFQGTNIVVWLDPFLNDLYISAITSDGTTTNIITSDPVPNLPTGKSVRVAIVFTELFSEVYVDGRLRQTKTYNKPLKDGGSNSFFTTPNISGSSVVPPELKRISFWPRPITAGEAMAGA
jgi:hypothetical protein